MNFVKILNLLVHQLSPSHFLRILFCVLQLFLFLPLRRLWETNSKHSSSSAFFKIEAEAGRRPGDEIFTHPGPQKLSPLFLCHLAEAETKFAARSLFSITASVPPLHSECSGRTRRGSLLPQGRRWAEARKRQRPNGRTDAVAEKKLAP